MEAGELPTPPPTVAPSTMHSHLVTEQEPSNAARRMPVTVGDRDPQWSEVGADVSCRAGNDSRVATSPHMAPNVGHSCSSGYGDGFVDEEKVLREQRRLSPSVFQGLDPLFTPTVYGGGSDTDRVTVSSAASASDRIGGGFSIYSTASMPISTQPSGWPRPPLLTPADFSINANMRRAVAMPTHSLGTMPCLSRQYGDFAESRRQVQLTDGIDRLNYAKL